MNQNNNNMNQNNKKDNKIFYNRDEIINILMEEYENFTIIAGIGILNKEGIGARIKEAPTQFVTYGLFPYLTFLLSKYSRYITNENEDNKKDNKELDKRDQKDKSKETSNWDKNGYARFLNFLIYIIFKYYRGLFEEIKISEKENENKEIVNQIKNFIDELDKEINKIKELKNSNIPDKDKKLREQYNNLMKVYEKYIFKIENNNMVADDNLFIRLIGKLALRENLTKRKILENQLLSILEELKKIYYPLIEL